MAAFPPHALRLHEPGSPLQFGPGARIQKSEAKKNHGVTEGTEIRRKIRSPQQALKPSDGLSLISTGEIMLPQPHHPPSPAPQPPVHQPVPFLVRRELSSPEGRVVLRLRGMTWTAVPKAPIHEHHDLFLPKHKIRFAEHHRMTTPSGDAMPPEQFHQGQFRVAVPTPADAGHHHRALGLGEDVCHSLRLLPFPQSDRVWRCFWMQPGTGCVS